MTAIPVIHEIASDSAPSEALPDVLPPACHDQKNVDSFALAVVEYGGNIGAAYSAVFGGSPRTGISLGHILINTDARVMARVEQIRESTDDLSILSRSVHIGELARLRDVAEAQGAIKVAVHCEVKRGEVAGFYDRVLQKGPNDGQLTVTINMAGGQQVQPVQYVENV